VARRATILTLLTSDVSMLCTVDAMLKLSRTCEVHEQGRRRRWLSHRWPAPEYPTRSLSQFRPPG
jgi:hypothetical protein